MPLSLGYLTPEQREIVESPLDSRLFIKGPAGTGKTTVGVMRLLYLLQNGIPGNEILVLVPQRTLAKPYFDLLHSISTPAGSTVTIATISGLARRMIDLFWPLVAEDAGFSNYQNPPIFLTLETAQYFMAHIVRPRFGEGFFDNVTINHNRLYSQILDNLNKAAVQNFPYTEIGDRLKAAWIGDPGQIHVYEDAQECATNFRRYCLKHNLLDFSLQIEIFTQILWPIPAFQDYLHQTYNHLVFDNVEEETPAAADLFNNWLTKLDSVLLIFDQNAGYRHFLGASPDATFSLAGLCDVTHRFNQSFITSPGISNWGNAFANTFNPNQPNSLLESEVVQDNEQALHYPIPSIRLFPEMLDWVTDQIAALIDSGTDPGEIVILAPYLSDALRFSLIDRFNLSGIPSRSHRPSRSLREEPSTRCMLTLAKLSHPDWGLIPQVSDVAYALMQAIADLDLVRAQLLTQYVYRNMRLSPFEDLNSQIQERVSFLLGERYERLRLWLQEVENSNCFELDHFISRLFGELLSQPGYGFHGDINAGNTIAMLVESIQKFRRVASNSLASEGISIPMEYIQMVDDGVIASQYLTSWYFSPDNAVFIAPAYTFLMANRAVDYQFWLDVGGRGWYERLYQPLTHPYVLSKDWPVGKPWTDTDEIEASRVALNKLISGLIHRCRVGIFLGLSDLNEQGYENKGELLRKIDKAIRM